jgi:hypothetical protein
MKNFHRAIISEIGQAPSTRQKLIKSVSTHLNGRTLVCFCTSFSHPVNITDDDADMLQSVLQANDLSKGLALLISSPGGDGLAAERIVNICRSHSGTDDYWAIVPGKAKSAATIICMGASKILMTPSSELGPVDPQIFRMEDGRRKVFSAHALVTGFDNLFGQAANSESRLEPFLQQLQYYDHREINTYRSLIDLAENIAVKALRSGMLSGKKDTEIKKAIEVFLNPSAGTLSHGRPIYAQEAEACGLKIANMDVKSSMWRDTYELYVRLEQFVSMKACKTVESIRESFHVRAST